MSITTKFDINNEFFYLENNVKKLKI